MKVAEVRLRGFKRFTETTIVDIPQTTRLVVLAGPNGSGKSSIFDGFRTWHGTQGVPMAWDETYGSKVGSAVHGWHERALVVMHEPIPVDHVSKQKLVYIRSAFRNEADFAISSFGRMGSPLENIRVNRLVDNDVSVSDNFQRLVMQTIDGIYSSSIPDTATKAEIRDRVIGEVQRAMAEVFPDLMLSGVGGVGSSGSDVGTFYFSKGASSGFLYKNLSAGEKAAFDLILDMVVKREYYDNTIWCIDEPETHLNTRIQAALLKCLMRLLPDECQLWIASHSIGFMRTAWEMAKVQPGQVSFIDLQDQDFDSPIILRPVQPTREFWLRTLDVAMGDLASLVAPEHVVLCEGLPAGGSKKAEFDADCYRRIFSTEFPEVDFMSVGNAENAAADRIEVGRTIQTIAQGTKVTRLVDRDMKTVEEVVRLEASGVRVLGRRHLESYLLDDEVLAALCEEVGKPELAAECYRIKAEKITASIARGNDADDLKSAAGEIYNGLRRILELTSSGSNWSAFARDRLAPLIRSDMAVYGDLRHAIFGC